MKKSLAAAVTAVSNKAGTPQRDDSVMPAKGLARNSPCPCGSGRKFKKCCGDPAAHRAVLQRAAELADTPKGSPQTVVAMLRSGIDSSDAYAYFHTGDFICEENRHTKSADLTALWDAHKSAFGACTAEMQRELLDKIIGTGGTTDDRA